MLTGKKFISVKTNFQHHFKYGEVQNILHEDQNKDYFLPNFVPLSISLVSLDLIYSARHVCQYVKWFIRKFYDRIY